MTRDHQPVRTSVKSLEAELRDYALSFPEAGEDHPWGHIAVKVRGKAFVFLGARAVTRS